MVTEEANTTNSTSSTSLYMGICPYTICFITEFIGTGLMMFIGCMSCVWPLELGPTIPAFGFGFVILAIFQMFGHISPVHINPAVTVGIFILGKMNWKQALVYALAQYIGAIVGMFLLKSVMPEVSPRLCLLKINFNITMTKAFFVEFMSTFVLFMTFAGVVHTRNQNNEDFTPIRLGLTVAGLVFAAEPFTGAGLNPARALPPCILANIWRELWLYQVGPFAGMATAAVLYRFALDPNQTKSLYAFTQSKGL